MLNLTDAFGNVSTARFDTAYDLYLESGTDAKGNTASVETFDFRIEANRFEQPFEALLKGADQLAVGPRQKAGQHLDDDDLRANRRVH